MKKSKKRQSFEKKLKAYSAVAAGTLLLAPSAHAAVQYSGPQNIDVNLSNPTVFLDLDNNATDDFAFKYSFPETATGQAHFVLGNPAVSGAMINTSTAYNVNLPSNYSVRNTLTPPNTWAPMGIPDFYGIFTQTQTEVVAPPAAPPTSGNFNGTSGYIGIQFQTVCGQAFGWIQYSATADSTNGTIIDWAYEDNCGTPILAGDQGAPPIGVPTLNQWGLFALIALLAGAGTLMLRKQEQA